MKPINKVILEALILADHEANDDHVVIILFPTRRDYWASISQEVKHCYCTDSMCHPRDGVFIRFSSEPHGLRSLPAQVLIVVDQNHKDWNSDSLLLARERLKGSKFKKEVSLWSFQ